MKATVKDKKEKDDKAFRLGDRVEINNLKAPAEYNGTVGTIKEWLQDKKKWCVTCDYNGKDNRLASKYLTKT